MRGPPPRTVRLLLVRAACIGEREWLACKCVYISSIKRRRPRLSSLLCSACAQIQRAAPAVRKGLRESESELWRKLLARHARETTLERREFPNLEKWPCLTEIYKCAPLWLSLRARPSSTSTACACGTDAEAQRTAPNEIYHRNGLCVRWREIPNCMRRRKALWCLPKSKAKAHY